MPATLADMTNHTTLSKANAARWFDAHLGARIDTVQTRDGVTTWSPPTRTLSKHFKSMWLLDGSTVTLTQMTVEAITANSITLAWRCDDTGDVIHVTTYTAVTHADGECIESESMLPDAPGVCRDCGHLI